MFVLGIINAMMEFKQFCPLVLICVETNWSGTVVDSQWLYLVVGHFANLYNNNNVYEVLYPLFS